jgi:hypothetical protein
MMGPGEGEKGESPHCGELRGADARRLLLCYAVKYITFIILSTLLLKQGQPGPSTSESRFAVYVAYNARIEEQKTERCVYVCVCVCYNQRRASSKKHARPSKRTTRNSVPLKPPTHANSNFPTKESVQRQQATDRCAKEATNKPERH